MWRLILAVVLAPVFWGFVQFPGNLLLSSLFPQAALAAEAGGGPAQPLGYLLLALLLAFGYATFSGFCSAWVAATDPRRIGLYAGVVLLAVGIAVQASIWDMLPLWWHVVFLASIMPFALLGASLKGAPDTPEAQ